MILLLNPLLSNISEASTDEELVRKYMETHNNAYFDVLYTRYSPKVYAKCIAMLNSEISAQDAVQDIFVKILLQVSKFKGKAKFSTWLYAITYNHCIDYLRRDKGIIVSMEEQAYEFSLTDEAGDAVILETKISELEKILSIIPAKEKSILLMKYQDGLSIKDISEALDKSESAVKMQIKRAKEKFLVIRKELFPESA